jgi:glycosyltransferase involved in cell wall biosynthesis
MPSVCFVAANQGVPWGASEFLWAGAAETLANRHDVDVIACVKGWSSELDAVRRLRSAGCRILVRPTPDDEQAFWKAEVPAEAAAEIVRLRPDLVVISHGDNREGMPWMEFCAGQQIPFISLAHRASEWDWPDSALVPRLRAAYLGARGAHFVSTHNWHLTEQMIGARLDRGAVVRNPYQVDYAGALPWPAGDGPPRLACVARLDLESKAHDMLFNVLAARKWRDRELHVDVVGRAGKQAQVLRDLAVLLELDRVRFRDTVDDIRSVWAECHALILPSRKEGLPIAIVEAMLAGRPCLVTDIGGSAELIDPGHSGWVAESPTVAALDRALEEAWQSRDRWADMGRHAARTIRSLVPGDPAGRYADVLLQALEG